MLKDETTALGTVTHPVRSIEMHGRGHAYHGTTCDLGTGTACNKAGKWAARRLITPRAFLNAARNETCTHTIAATLNVSRDDVMNYLAALSVDEWMIMQRLIGHELR